jgi:antitoxin Phd
MRSWKLQDAKAKFSEFVDAALKKGPQVVTRRGVETAVLLPIEEWNRLQAAARPTVKEILLGPGPRYDDWIPERRRDLKLRKPVDID